jgi:AcrR family transcriptional regulator
VSGAAVPKIVDHDLRREKLLEASWRVIVRCGLDKTTIRELAKESGYSHGTWAYYFLDKDDILASALRLQHKRIEDRVARHVAEHRGLNALRHVILESLPMDEGRLLEAQIEMNFWVRSMTTKPLRQCVVTDLQGFRRLLKRLVRRARECRELVSQLTDDEVVHEILMLIDALSVEAVLSPALTPPKRQTAMLDHLLRQLEGPKRSSARSRPTATRKAAASRPRR